MRIVRLLTDTFHCECGWRRASRVRILPLLRAGLASDPYVGGFCRPTVIFRSNGMAEELRNYGVQVSLRKK